MSIDALHEKGWIDRHKPMWWDIDYGVDPRELVSLQDFQQRLKSFGTYPNICLGYPRPQNHLLYVGNRVPVVLLDVKLDGEDATLFATARPYNEREVQDYNGYFPPEVFEETLKEHGESCLDYNFFPHVRGISKERRKSMIFWHILQDNQDCCAAVKKSLGELADIFRIFSVDERWHRRVGAESYCDEPPARKTAFYELKRSKLIDHHESFVHQLRDLQEVAYDEFISGLCRDVAMIAVYPIKRTGIANNIPLVLSTRTGSESKRKPAVLGIMSSSSGKFAYRIWHLKDEDFCRYVSRELEDDLGVKFEVLCFRKEVCTVIS